VSRDVGTGQNAAMDVTSGLEAPCSAEALFDHLDDLATYPSWLGIVARAESTEPAGDDDATWIIDLKGRLGPLSRSKRLRMVRSIHDRPWHCRFERRELDGRNHSPWVLDVEIEEVDDDRATLAMHLHYGGGFGGALLERMLRDEIDRSRPQLLAQLT
jgi:hypothetical protein